MARVGCFAFTHRVSSSPLSPLISPRCLFSPKLSLSNSSPSFFITSCLSMSSTTFTSSMSPSTSEIDTVVVTHTTTITAAAATNDRWKWRPMCLYHTQGKCAKMDDPIHLERFNHDCRKDLQVNPAELGRQCAQDMDYFLVLDLEGKVEILEFPVLIIDAKTLDVVDLFHRFVKPTQMSERRINEYIEGKYGKFGVDRVWHDTAIAFNEVIDQFEAWLTHHKLWEKKQSGLLNGAAFVTCGNWDLKTKVPQQCKVARMKLPSYFMEWINLKDVYLNFYKREARGMMAMMKQLGIPVFGSHHLGLDDTKNIARVLQHMVLGGAVMKITARRNPKFPDSLQFLFDERIR